MSKMNLPASTKRFLRFEKARIRRTVLDVSEQNKLINELYGRILRKPKTEAEKVLENKEVKKEEIKEIKKEAAKPAQNPAKKSGEKTKKTKQETKI